MVFRKRVFARKTKRRFVRRKKMPLVRLVRTHRLSRIGSGPKRRSGAMMPQTKIVTMRYATEGQVSIDASQVTVTYRANSIFKPEILVAGHQPRNYDQWMTLYENWVVLSSSIQLRAFNTATALPCALSIFITDVELANNTTYLDAMENAPRTTIVGTWNHESGSRGGFVKSGVNVAKYKNRRNLKDDLDLIGDSGADVPAAGLITYNCNFLRAGTSNVGLTDYTVVISYRVMLLNPKKFTGS